MQKRWVGAVLSLVAVCTSILITAPAGARAGASASSGPPLVLTSQTPWVGAASPWFKLNLAVRDPGVPASQLRVNVSFYSRIGDESQLQQATSSSPDKSVLSRVNDVALTPAANGSTAALCVTVLPDSAATAPAATGAACAANTPTVYLDCRPNTGTCGDVYPVSVTLTRQGSSNAIERFTTFLTYEESTGEGGTGPLRVSWVVPVSGTSAPSVVSALSAHHQVPVTLAVNPRTVAELLGHGHADARTVQELGALTDTADGDQLMAQPFVPVSLAGLEAAGLGGEIDAQLDRGAQLLRQAKLHPSSGTWVDPTSNLSAPQGGALAKGLAEAGDSTVVLNDTVLSAAGSSSEYTFAHPFTLSLTKTSHPAALAANSSLAARFSSDPGDPVLAASQLLAGLAFIHFENASLTDPRGVVLVPPAGWQPTSAFVNTLLAGLGDDPVLSAVTLSTMTTQVIAGGNGDPATRRLQSGAPSGTLAKAAATRIALDRQNLASFAAAVSGHPAQLGALNDDLLRTEAAGLTTAQRTAAIAAYDRVVDRALGAVSLASERTVTFTARTANIPITVLSSAPYPVRVVMTVDSDKFDFPNGNTRTMLLDRPTTPIRVEAKARTSGDRLPVTVTLRTPDGRLLIARTTLTVHSTSISIVGIALTVLAGLVLLVWWGRTWRRSRQRRPRAH